MAGPRTTIAAAEVAEETLEADLAGPRTTIAAAEAAGETLEVRDRGGQDRGGIVAHVAMAGPHATIAAAEAAKKTHEVRDRGGIVAYLAIARSRTTTAAAEEILEVQDRGGIVAHVAITPRLPPRRPSESKIAEASLLRSR